LIPTSAIPRTLPAALFLVTLATVMFQVLLTRVFSLTMWYHFAFMAISMAMLGLTVGALAVFLRPSAWPEATLARAMGRCATLFAVSIAGVILAHTLLFIPNPSVDFWPMAWTFVAAAVPFAFSGVFVCLALTRFPSRIGQLYAVDLAGAAIGCLCVIASLQWLDGVGAVLGCAALAGLAGVFLLRGTERTIAALVCAVLAGATLWAGIHLALHDLAAFPIRYIKWSKQQEVEYERWNSFSRIAVMKQDTWHGAAWSLSPVFAGAREVATRNLQIDAGAGTTLIGFDGDLAKADFLRWDLVNFPHHLRSGARVCIVGSGGGRDILTAKVFGQKQVTAVEINGDILKVVNGHFGDFTGHLDRDPAVRLVHDEARSYLARSRDRFDIVQLTFIDTWAATAAGAYVLTENSLYTVEAWKIFLDRLEDDGLLVVARGLNFELERLVSLGRAALRASGAEQPERHMVLVTNRTAGWPSSFGPMGLLLVRKTPFPEQELARAREVAKQMQFQIELQPGMARTPLLDALASGRGMEDLLAKSAVNYDAPTDDQPFFFNMLRVGNWMVIREPGRTAGQYSVMVLMDLLAGVFVLTLLCIVLPLAVARVALPRGGIAHLAFFAAIGTGFMLIEISMLQRLIIFLGHPIYSLSVILFVLLLACGLGAWLSTRIAMDRLAISGVKILALLTIVLVATGLATGPLVAAFQDAETPLRIAISGLILAAMGVFMGMAFPLGMRLAMRSQPRLAPWLWGVNGAMSVLASVLAVAIALAYGISASFWAGVASYALATVAFAAAVRRSAA
jgi:predicted membrane-bound spermidine synthase